ncbi:FtsK/SpoIIIE domain-containing protein [Pseudactinotalea sp. Z1732]|uniref:FtsK/SpoIIIE domain-containing protein n=1 Tax=Pseudactinotalea sp. Z1732 TaxID=3413026 RepID=UPI003C7A3871
MADDDAARVRGAMRTHVHIAVIAGPDAGWVAGLDSRGIIVGRGADAGLRLCDAHLSRNHLHLRHRSGRIQVRDLDSANGSRWRPARGRSRAQSAPGAGGSGLRWRRRSRRVTGRWRRIRAGDLLHVGTSTLQVRPHPSLRAAEPARARAGSVDPAMPGMVLPLLMSVGMVPALLAGGAGLWRLLPLLLIPMGLALAWPALNRRRRRHRPQGPEAPTGSGPTGPLGPSSPDAPTGCPRVDDPAALIVAAQRGSLVPAPGQCPAEEAGWDVGTADAGLPAVPAHGGRSGTRRAGCLPVPADGAGVALVGGRAESESLARYLLCQLVVRSPPGHWRTEVPDGWAWATALPDSGDGPARVLRVLEAEDAADGADVAAAHLVLARHLGQVPPWCARIIQVRPGHDRRVSSRWAGAVCSVLATGAHAVVAIPRVAPLAELIGPHTATDIGQRWRSADTGLAAHIGHDGSGPVCLDLVREGPHAVVAGTTGSGKSELLLSWVLALAARYPPGNLAFLLVDYKGGATFAPISPLPQVLGVLTDLDGSATSRALASLRAELLRREQILARAGATNLAEYQRGRPDGEGGGGRLPRLMVIVDEFRAMSDDHPEHLDDLVRLAAQGRSLGIHLVLATQRPAGAISADMRANLTTRLCLRVLEEADSTDTIGMTAAARLPAVPGRAILRTETTTTFQSAWGGDTAAVGELVDAIRSAAEDLIRTEPWRADLPPPWAPPLPESLTVTELPAGPAQGWLRTDLPEEQRLGVGTLDLPASIVISGPPGSGRSTAAATLAGLALRRGVAVHVLAEDPLIPETAPAAGTWCASADVRRAGRLLHLLAGRRGAEMLVIDDVDAWAGALDEVAGAGAGTDLIATLLRRARRRGLSAVLTAPVPAHRWAAQVDQHLVLAPRDPADAALAGVPKELTGSGWPPGRGVLLTPRTSVVCQVALPEDAGAETWPPPDGPVLRLRPLPQEVALTDRPATPEQPQRIWLGIGDDDATWVGAHLPPGATWLIAGMPGRGRSTTLATIGAQVRQRTDVLMIDDVDRLTPAQVTRTLTLLADRTRVVVGAAHPDRLLNTYHDLAARLREADVVVALGAVSPHLTGVDIRSRLDPDPEPGRGVLVEGPRVVPVQVARPDGVEAT